MDDQTLNQVMSTYGINSNAVSGTGFNLWGILVGLLFSIAGFFAFKYGWKEKAIKPSLIGLALMIYPYFVSNTIISIFLGLGLCAALYYWRD